MLRARGALLRPAPWLLPLPTPLLRCAHAPRHRLATGPPAAEPPPPLPDGVTKELVAAAPEGAPVQRGQSVTVHCTGYGKDGDLEDPFWSTRDAGQGPFSFRIGEGEVITAWDAGVLTMRVGERATIMSTADNAYGPATPPHHHRRRRPTTPPTLGLNAVLRGPAGCCRAARLPAVGHPPRLAPQVRH